jgi:hypothetical protein
MNEVSVFRLVYSKVAPLLSVVALALSTPLPHEEAR